MCENTSISMCDNGGREVKNGPNLCYVIFERSLIYPFTGIPRRLTRPKGLNEYFGGRKT